METVIAAIALAFLLGFFILFVLIEPRRCSAKQETDFCRLNYAHRGLHTRDLTVPENSLAAFRRAADAGYGIELDVRLTRDGEVVVCHDDDLHRVTGKTALVSELDYVNLADYPLHGTAERVPRFADVLETVAGRVPLLVELKTGPRRVELCEKTLALLEAYGGLYCIESFDPRIVAWFNKHRANVFRGQLTASYRELREGTGKAAAFAVSRVLLNCIARPHFIAHQKGKKSALVRLCEFLGAKRFVWTVRDTDDVESIAAASDSVIFEFYTPRTWLR